MKEMLKRLCVASMALVMMVCLTVPVNAQERLDEGTDGFTVIADNKHLVSEYGDTFIIDYSKIDKNIIIVDGKYYSSDTISKVVSRQVTENNDMSLVDYLIEEEEYIEISPLYELWDAPPKTGYTGVRTYRGDFARPSVGAVLGLTASALSILAGFLGFDPGTAKTLMRSLIEIAAGVAGVGAVLGTPIDTRAQVYRRLHNYYPSYEDENKHYVRDAKGGKTFGKTVYVYEWYSDPSGY